MCLFCIAVFAMLAATITGAILDQLESRLQTVAVAGSVQRGSDTDSATTIACAMPVPSIAGEPPPTITTAPVLLTVYKAQKRIRIQVQTHAVSAKTAEAIQDAIAAACGLKIVSRSSEQTRQSVTEASIVLGAASGEISQLGSAASTSRNPG